MPIPELVLLLDDAETLRALKVSIEELEALVAADTLSPIFIHSKRRFLLDDVEALARTRHR